MPRHTPTPQWTRPQKEFLAAMLPVPLLAVLRGQARPGERVAIYRSACSQADNFALICGAERVYREPPRTLGAGSGAARLAGVVEVTEDGEESLAGAYA